MSTLLWISYGPNRFIPIIKSRRCRNYVWMQQTFLTATWFFWGPTAIRCRWRSGCAARIQADHGTHVSPLTVVQHRTRLWTLWMTNTQSDQANLVSRMPKNPNSTRQVCPLLCFCFFCFCYLVWHPDRCLWCVAWCWPIGRNGSRRSVAVRRRVAGSNLIVFLPLVQNKQHIFSFIVTRRERLRNLSFLLFRVDSWRHTQHNCCCGHDRRSLPNLANVLWTRDGCDDHMTTTCNHWSQSHELCCQSIARIVRIGLNTHQGE